uniref:Uncharacterized protein n=1 Tax=Anguilla anguilla TaxID=7936 RepID=A0A0E9UI05_ANGAN
MKRCERSHLSHTSEFSVNCLQIQFEAWVQSTFIIKLRLRNKCVFFHSILFPY